MYLTKKVLPGEGPEVIPDVVILTEGTFGIGPGIEQNTHKIGECVDLRELEHAIAVLARYPSTAAPAAPGVEEAPGALATDERPRDRRA